MKIMRLWNEKKQFHISCLYWQLIITAFVVFVAFAFAMSVPIRAEAQEQEAQEQEICEYVDMSDFLYQEGALRVYEEIWEEQEPGTAIPGTSDPTMSTGEVDEPIPQSEEEIHAEAEAYILSQFVAKSEEINIRSYKLTREELQYIISGIINENPNLFYIYPGYSIYKYVEDEVEYVSRFIPKYNEAYDEELFAKAVDEALACINPSMSDLEKVMALHDYLGLNAEYDKDRLADKTIPRSSYSAYGVLVDHIGVCQSYSLAYKYLLNQVGVDCHIVTSREMNHAWNLVKLGSNYYHIDSTWDDPTCDRIGRVSHRYFAMSDYGFKNATNGGSRHHDWEVTIGSQIVELTADDAGYEKSGSFWPGIQSPIVFDAKNECYYLDGTEIIKRTFPAGEKEIFFDLSDIYEELYEGVYNVSADALKSYSGLFGNQQKLYFNTGWHICRMDLRTGELEIVFALNENDAIGEQRIGRCNQMGNGEVWYSIYEASSSQKEKTYKAALEKAIAFPKKVRIVGFQKNMYVGQTQSVQLEIAKVNEMDNIRVYYYSSDPQVAKVNVMTGAIHACKPGNTEITVIVKANGWKDIVAETPLVVKEVQPIGSVKINEIEDTKAKVSWKKNETGQLIEVYAFRTNEYLTGSLGNQQKLIGEVFANSMLNNNALSKFADEKGKVADYLIDSLAANGLILDAYAICPSSENEVVLGCDSDAKNRFLPDSPYTIYIRNYSAGYPYEGETYISTNGVAGKMIRSAKPLFGKLILEDETTLDEQNRICLDYQLLAKEGCSVPPQGYIYSKVSAVSSDKAIVSVKVVEINEKPMIVLQPGAKAGIANVTMSCKDAAGRARTSENSYCFDNSSLNNPKLVVTKCSNKQNTLVLGQSMYLRDCIKYDVAGDSSRMDLSVVALDEALETLITYQDEIGYDIFRIDVDESARYTKLTAINYPPDNDGQPKENGEFSIPVYYMSNDAKKEAYATFRIKPFTAPSLKLGNVREHSADCIMSLNLPAEVNDLEPYVYELKVKNIAKDTTKVETIPLTSLKNGTVPLSNSNMKCLSGLYSGKEYEVCAEVSYQPDESDQIWKATSKPISFKTAGETIGRFSEQILHLVVFWRK